jgi:hypothetical protein
VRRRGWGDTRMLHAVQNGTNFTGYGLLHIFHPEKLEA